MMQSNLSSRMVVLPRLVVAAAILLVAGSLWYCRSYSRETSDKQLAEARIIPMQLNDSICRSLYRQAV
jgi:hypothetical protein